METVKQTKLRILREAIQSNVGVYAVEGGIGVKSLTFGIGTS